MSNLLSTALSLSNGQGHTHWLPGKERTTGYVVACKEYETILSIGDLTQSIIDQQVQNAIDNDAEGIGFWVDDNQLYLDVVHVFEDRGLALHFAQLWEQLAIYDLANKQVIYR
jgi:hypothetical protein